MNVRRSLEALCNLSNAWVKKYQVEELAAKYNFTGHTSLTVPEALAIKEELEKIDELLKQLEEARETAQITLIDMESLAEFTEPGDLTQLESMRQLVEDYVRELAQRQGLTQDGGAFHLTPKAYRLFQGRLLEKIFSHLQASRSGRHQGAIVGEGAVEMQQTKQYEFGDSWPTWTCPSPLSTPCSGRARACRYNSARTISKSIELGILLNVPPWS